MMREFGAQYPSSKKLRVLAVILSLAHGLQSGPVYASLAAVQPDSRPSGYSIEERFGSAEWEITDEGVSLGTWAADTVEGLSESIESIWDRATEWAREQLAPLGETHGNLAWDDQARTYSDSWTLGTAHDSLWWLNAINAPEAWGLSTGAGTTVAVIDTGVDHTHTALQSNIWTSPSEIQSNGIDDNNNGLVDDWRGWDFVNSDNDARDDQGHGTHVAGIIAGIAPSVKILGVKVLDQFGSGTFDNIIRGIRYAADQGARIINMSLGAMYDFSLDYIRTHYASYFNAYIQPIQDAILYAAGKGSIVIAASGNSGVDVNRTVPAGFTETLSVGATTTTEGRAYFSNYGATLDLTAPGWDILSLRANGTTFGTAAGTGYARASGTSMAAPMVSGVVALLLSQDPTLDLAGIERRLKYSSLDLGAEGFDTSFGYGQVDALKAITHDYFADGTVKSRWLLEADQHGIVRYNYDESGAIVSAVGSDGTFYDHDPTANRITYFPSGRISSRYDALTDTFYEYLDEDLDGQGSQRVARKVDPDGTATAYTYWAGTTVIKQIKITSPDGTLQSVQVMSADGTLLKRTDYAGDIKTETAYFANGQARQVSVWTGARRDSVTRFFGDGATQYLATYKDGVIDRELYYDERGRMTKDKRYAWSAGSPSADVIQKSYTYWDDTDQVKVVKLHKNTALVGEERFNADGRLTARVTVDGAVKTETLYHLSGGARQITVWQDGIKGSILRYFESGALQYSVVYQDGSIQTETLYDDLGRVMRDTQRVARADDPALSDLHVTTYAYWNGTAQVRSVTLKVNGALDNTKTYDADGALLSTVEVNGAVKTQTLYWASGQVRQVTVWEGAEKRSVLRYFESGALQYSVVYQDGSIQTETLYDDLGRVKREAQRVPQPANPTVTDLNVMTYAYWNATSQVRSVTLKVNGALDNTKRYDEQGTLLSVTQMNGDVKTDTLYWGSGQVRQVTVRSGSQLVSQTRYFETGLTSYLMIYLNGAASTLTQYWPDGSIRSTKVY